MAQRKIVPGVQWKGRFREDLMKALRDASQTRGVSLNEEIEDRLSRSFERQSLLRDVLEMSYGQKWADFFMAFHSEGNMRMSDAAIDRLVKKAEKFLRAQIEKGRTK